MRNMWAIYTRELKSYFISPIFYILATVFVLVVGNSFKNSFFEFASTAMNMLRRAQNYGGEIPIMNIGAVGVQMFQFMDFLFLMIVPLLTMRLYSEEKKTGTMELLMTSPVTTSQVLMGKFFSCLTIYTILTGLTGVFIFIMFSQSGGKLDMGPVISSYLGVLLLGTTLIAIGMFFSSVTENQIVAAAITLSVLMALWLLPASAKFLKYPINELVENFSMSTHLDYLIKGTIGINNIVYFLSMTTFWLFITGVNVESARWRQ